MNGSFNGDELKKLDWQYLISHNSEKCFKIGEWVFLKSNPELPLKISQLKNGQVSCQINDIVAVFPPQCLLQYKYAGLFIWKDDKIICLN